MLDNNIPDWALFDVDSIRETRDQANQNAAELQSVHESLERRLDAIEDRLDALEVLMS